MEHIIDILTGGNFYPAASVFNPLSAAIAHDVGFKCGVVGGSIVAANVNLSPDYGLITMSELVDTVRRICIQSELPIIVDGDSGYGNALNTQRLIQELEFAGASAVTLEDSILPFQYQNRHSLAALDEHRDKLLAALEARKSSKFSIIARTKMNSSEGFPSLLKRIEAYAQTEVDGICIFGDVQISDLRILNEISSKPLMLISYSASRKDYRSFKAGGVKILLNGHHAFEASVRSMFHAYQDILDHKKRDIAGKDIITLYSKVKKLDVTAKRYMDL
ncbi:MAG: isocitrate lyase/PEP mutase family protein [Marinomonas foliarum]|jgi:oxaloacetate decarboxylase